MVDSTLVQDATTGINLVYGAVSSVIALISFVAGRIHALRKKR